MILIDNLIAISTLIYILIIIIIIYSQILTLFSICSSPWELNA
jgi:hypothetical protein